jgi:hypothetical protein
MHTLIYTELATMHVRCNRILLVSLSSRPCQHLTTSWPHHHSCCTLTTMILCDVICAFRTSLSHVQSRLFWPHRLSQTRQPDLDRCRLHLRSLTVIYTWRSPLSCHSWPRLLSSAITPCPRTSRPCFRPCCMHVTPLSVLIEPSRCLPDLAFFVRTIVLITHMTSSFASFSIVVIRSDALLFSPSQPHHHATYPDLTPIAHPYYEDNSASWLPTPPPPHTHTHHVIFNHKWIKKL